MKQLSPTRSRESGQAMIIIAFSFIGLLAFVGIVVDLGRYLAAQVQLRRAVDAAALAGAAQFRLEGSSTTEADVYTKVDQAARAMLRAHGVTTDTLASGVVVDTRYTRPGDPDFDSPYGPPRKKVRVTVNSDMDLIFLSLIGWRTAPLAASSITEAAAVDVALVLDISDSMDSDTNYSPPCTQSHLTCVYRCDNANPRFCEPFNTVRASAKEFLNYLSRGYDRVTVIPFARAAGFCINQGDNWPYCPASAYDPDNGLNGDKYVPLTTNLDTARTFIDNLHIDIYDWAGDPPIDPTPPCPGRSGAAEGWDPRQCTNTNVGAGMRAAATELTKEFDPLYAAIDPQAGPNHPSKERLRVVVLLTDGAANNSGLGAEGPDYAEPDVAPPPANNGLGFCPRYTWYPVGAVTGPFCRAMWPVLTGPKQDTLNSRHTADSVYYDAIDYALDWTDFAGLDPKFNGNGMVIFTIGLGDQVWNTGGGTLGDPAIGGKLLRYMAAAGDDGDLSTDPCAPVAGDVTQTCGNYYFAPTAAELRDIFKSIAGRIFTRINQ